MALTTLSKKVLSPSGAGLVPFVWFVYFTRGNLGEKRKSYLLNPKTCSQVNRRCQTGSTKGRCGF